MSNGSNIRKSKATSKNFIVDYRDAKYQGEISEYERRPNGMGMLMSIDYQLMIANWQEGMINGQCLCVYPDGNVLYGTIKNNQLMGFTSYQVQRKKYIYSIITKESHCWFFIDCQITKSLLALRVSSQEVSQLLSYKHYLAKTDQQSMVSYIENNLKRQHEIVQQFNYQSQEKKWDNIARLTGKTISNEWKNMKAFLKYHFNVHAPNKDCRLEITQTQEFTELRYKKAGILCRIDENAKNQNRVKFLGYYDSYEEHSDVYRKITAFEGEILQYCEGHSLSYQKERPAICKKNLQNHFRKSVHFVNHFISMQFMHRVQHMYSQIFISIQGEMSTKNAQLQLQKGGEQKGVAENRVIQDRQEMSEKFKKIELADIKNDIYNKVKKRKNSPRTEKDTSFTQKHIVEKNVISNYFISKQYKENYQLRGLERRYLDQPIPKRTVEYLRYAQNSPAARSRHSRSQKRDQSIEHPNRRKYSYIPPEESIDVDYMPDRNIQRSVSNAFLERNNDYTGIKEEGNFNYKFHNKPRAFNAHIESISTLTNNYERIKVQLSQQKKLNSKRQQERSVSPSYNAGTPSNRSPSRVSYLKYAVHSPSGAGGRRRQWR